MGINRQDLIPEINRLREEMKGKYGYARSEKAYKILVKKAYAKGVYNLDEYRAAMRYERVAQRYAQAQSYQSMMADKNFKPISKTGQPAQPKKVDITQSILYKKPTSTADIIIKPTSNIKLDEMKEQAALKQALPRYSAVADISGRDVELNAVTVEPKDQPEIRSGQEQRIEKLLEREQRLQNFINFGGVLEKDPNKSKWSLGEIGKTVARKPLEMGSAPVFIGGRLALAADLTTSKRGRQELSAAKSRVIPALAQAYNPTTPSGLINIGLTATSIYSIGKARATARQDIKVSAEGISTKRINTKTKIIDQSKGRAEAVFGKNKITGEIKTNEVFYKTTDVKYFSEGSGSLKYTLPSGKTKLVGFDTRGISNVQPSSVNSLTVSKITQGATKGQKFFITNTKTASLVKQPLQTFRSLSSTKAYGAKTSIYAGKDYAISTGITSESLRLPVYTESGKVLSVEQALNTGRISMGAKTFNQNYVFTQPKTNVNYLIKPSKSIFASKSGSVGRATFKTDLRSIPKTTTAGSTAPVAASTSAGFNVALTQLKLAAQGLKSAQIKGFSTLGAVGISGIKTSPKTQQIESPAQKLRFKLAPAQFQGIKPKQQPISSTSIRAQSISAQAIKPQTIQPQAISPISITEQAIKPQQISEQRVVSDITTPMTMSPTIATPTGLPPPPIPTLFGVGSIPYLEFPSKPSKRKRVKFKSKYTPSIEAELFNIKGKKSKFAEISGIGLRKITKTGGI